MRIGLTLTEYWRLTPIQVEKCVQAYKLVASDRAKEIDALNRLLGLYIYYAVNKPKSYPSKPYLAEAEVEVKKTDEVMSTEQFERVMRHNTIKLGGKINNGNES